MTHDRPMMEKLPRVSPVTMMAEVKDVDIGDERLNNRFMEIMGALASSPGSSFAGLFSKESAVEATYRFMRNPSVDWEDLLEPHLEETAHRCEEAGSVIIIHDTTTHRVPDDADLESYINTGKKGFLAHASLAVRENGDCRPLGLLGMQCVFRKKRRAKTKKKGRALSGAETAKLKNKEFDRWAKGVDSSSERLGEGVDAIHATDREGDSFGFFARLDTDHDSFVIRECKNRSARLAGDDSDEWSKIHELLDKAKRTRIRRKIHVGKRRKKTAPGAAKANPARAARSACLKVAYVTLELRKPLYLKTAPDCPESLKLNVVHVYEVNPPEGEERIEWVLLTNLPVGNAVEAERVVDIYLRRWLIEEFFAALKGGCAYRKRHLTNRFSILNTLAALAPVAWKALDLRELARSARSPADEAFGSLEIEALRAKARKMGSPLSRKPSAQEALHLIARMGGHRKSSGPPGWRTLMKGMDRFLGIAEGYALARANL